MWNLCCSSHVKKQHNYRGFTGELLTSFSLRFFFRLTWPLLFTEKIVICENISLLKVGGSNQNAMLIVY